MGAAKRSKWTIKRARAFTRYFLVGIETPLGRAADLVVILAIVIGVMELILDSVPSIHATWGGVFYWVEVVVGVLFIFDYLSRLWSATKKLEYVFSFFGIIDLLAVMPFIIGLFAGDIDLTFLRLFRVMRVFSVLKVGNYSQASKTLLESLKASGTKISIFLLGVVILVICEAFVIYSVEPQTFPTVPDALWWSIVTITTVGYGDVYPATVVGKIIAALAMVTSFGIIAVPTGIVAAESRRASKNDEKCPRCMKDNHQNDANYCARCGTLLVEAPAALSE